MIQFMLLAAAIISFLLGMVVLANNPSKAINRTYFLLAVSASLWLIANALVLDGFFKLTDADAYLFAGRLITPTSITTAYLIMLFIAYFMHSPLHENPKKLSFLAIPGILIILLSYTDLNVSLAINGSLMLGNLIVPFALTTLVYLSVVVYLLFFDRYENKKGIDKAQVKYIRRAFILSVPPSSLIGVILPVFTDDPLINVGPLFSIIFLGYTALLIIRHHLFDIRFFVVRVLAYGTTLLLLSVVYLLPAVFVLSNVLSIPLKAETYWIIMAIAPIIVFGYGSLRNYLDKVTSRVFFRSSYDPQQFVAELNRVVVSNFEVEKLLTDVAGVITRNFKASYCIFVLKDQDQNPKANNMRYIGARKKDIDNEKIMAITESLTSDLPRVLITEYVRAEKIELQRRLSSLDIAVFASLRTREHSQEPTGYILLGPKKSGQQYDRQDVRTMEIMIDGLIVATQNALRFEEIAHFNVTLQKEIHEATDELRTKNAQLRHLDATKDEFLSIASHQLRTPLTSIKGYLSMILEGDVGKVSGTQRHLLSEAFASSERMVHLIHDFLNVSRLQTGKFMLERHPYDLVKLVREEIESLERTAEARNMKLKFESNKDSLMLNIDENKVRQIVMNFADNALYYSHEGTTITVDLATTDDKVELRVNDTGIGVPKSEQGHLFNKFYRASNARKQRPDGTGVGLFLAKKVVTGHGGNVLFESTEGKGSTFGFALPLADLEVKEGSENSVEQLVEQPNN